MNFAAPIVLLLLVIPLGLLIYQWLNHTRALPLPFDHAQTKGSKGISILLNIVYSLPLLVLACVILIFAGPRKFATPEAKRQMTNIMFCLDVSGSMVAPFGENDRYHVAMESLNEFLTYREGDSFSLLVFGGDNLRWIPLTTDVSAFSCAIPFLHPNALPDWFSGGTAIGAALKQAKRFLNAVDEGDKLIVLLSDGHSADLNGGQEIVVAEELMEAGISVFSIHIGNGAPSSKVQLISSMTGGQTFVAGDPETLEAIFKRIDEMAQAPVERLTPDPIDNFFPYLVTCLSLLGVYLFSLFGLRYSPW